MRTMRALLIVACLVPLPTWATTYTYVTIDVPFPQASDTVVTGLNFGGVAVGLYLDGGSRDMGFFWPLGHAVQALFNCIPQGISSQNLTVVGSFVEHERTFGFAFARGHFALLNVPSDPGLLTRQTEALGINDAGTIIVGDFRASTETGDVFQAFRLKLATNDYRRFAFPGASATSFAAINNLNVIVGSFLDVQEQSHGLRSVAGVMTEVVAPGLTNIALVGITDGDLYAGNAFDLHVGFVMQGGVVQLIQFPQAQLTELEGSRNDGVVYGRYIGPHGFHHGFLAIPDGTPLAPQASLAAPAARAGLASVCVPGSKRLACRRAGGQQP